MKTSVITIGVFYEVTSAKNIANKINSHCQRHKKLTNSIHLTYCKYGHILILLFDQCRYI
jgi:hypothetical protein